MKRKIFTLFLLVLINNCLAIEIKLKSRSDSVTNQTFNIYETNEVIELDGKLLESFWNKATKIELSYEVFPGENLQAPVKTFVYLAHTSDHFYVGFEAFDPEPENIRARLTDRDKIFNNDWVAVVLDTYNDERAAFEFFCNPLGIQADAIESRKFDQSWDAIWDSKGKINKDGYVVEMSIPFSSLRFQGNKGSQVWGFDAVRSYPRKARHHISTIKIDRDNDCYFCQIDKIVGFESVTPGNNIELTPTLSLNLSRSRENGTSGDFQWENRDFEPGLTGKWGISPNIILGGTLNPDFSHVEADAAIVDINEPFAVYFPEKRSFFTEGSDFFNSKINAVYTRSLRNPDWGVKLTGKEKSHTVGAYLVKDNITNLIFPGNESSDDSSMTQHSYATVLRYKKDIGNKYTIGALLTDRQGPDYYNRVYGIDADLRITNKDRFSFIVGGSSTNYPSDVVSGFNQPDGTFNDKVYDFSFNHRSRNIDYWLSYESYGDNFRADQGFIPKVGYKEYLAGGGYRWINKNTGKWWNNLIIRSSYAYSQTTGNNLLQKKYDLWFVFDGTLQSFSSIRYTRQTDRYEGEYYEQDKMTVNQSINPNKDIRLYYKLIVGDQIDFSNERPGHRFYLNPGLEFYPGKHLEINFSYILDNLSFYGTNIYKANIYDATVVYQFTPKLFLRAIVQYKQYKYNTSMYIDDQDAQEKSLFSQVLLSYKLNPQTAFFIGYSDDYSNNDNFHLVQTDKSLFFKLSYAFVL